MRMDEWAMRKLLESMREASNEGLGKTIARLMLSFYIFYSEKFIFNGLHECCAFPLNKNASYPINYRDLSRPIPGYHSIRPRGFDGFTASSEVFIRIFKIFCLWKFID